MNLQLLRAMGQTANDHVFHISQAAGPSLLLGGRVRMKHCSLRARVPVWVQEEKPGPA